MSARMLIPMRLCRRVWYSAGEEVRAMAIKQNLCTHLYSYRRIIKSSIVLEARLSGFRSELSIQ